MSASRSILKTYRETVCDSQGLKTLESSTSNSQKILELEFDNLLCRKEYTPPEVQKFFEQ